MAAALHVASTERAPDPSRIPVRALPPRARVVPAGILSRAGRDEFGGSSPAQQSRKGTRERRVGRAFQVSRRAAQQRRGSLQITLAQGGQQASLCAPQLRVSSRLNLHVVNPRLVMAQQ